MKKRIDITISVPTYNNCEMLRLALDSLMSQETCGDFSFEILVINDGSSDDTPLLVKEFSKKSRVPLRYSFQNGSGVAKARNRSIDLARGDWVVFFDDDQVVEQMWLSKLFNAALVHKADCVASNKDLVPFTNFEIPQNSIIRALLGEELYINDFWVKSYKNLPGTGNTIIKKHICSTLGGFDESMLSGGSDYEFFRRALKSGYRIYWTTKAIVHHLIQEYRLKYDYLKQISLRIGGNFAYIDKQIHGSGRRHLCFIGRIVKASAIHIPRLALAKIARNKTSVLGYKCLVWRAIGYAKHTLKIGTSSDISFRHEKALFKSD